MADEQSQHCSPLSGDYLLEFKSTSLSHEQQQSVNSLVLTVKSFLRWCNSAADRHFNCNAPKPQLPFTTNDEYYHRKNAARVAYHEFYSHLTPRNVLYPKMDVSGRSTHTFRDGMTDKSQTLVQVLRQCGLVPDIENISLEIGQLVKVTTETSASPRSPPPAERIQWIVAVFYNWNEITRTMDATIRTILLSLKLEGLRGEPREPLKHGSAATNSTTAVEVAVDYSYRDLEFNHQLWKKIQPPPSTALAQAKKDMAKYDRDT